MSSTLWRSTIRSSLRTPSALRISPRRAMSLLLDSPRYSISSYRQRYSTATGATRQTAPPIDPVPGSAQDFEATRIINPKLSEKGQPLRIAITERAAKRLQEIMEKEANPNLVLRAAVESGGCHGFQYLMSLRDMSEVKCQEKEEDTVFVRDGARVAVDETSLGLLRDSKVDYTTELIGSQFKIVDSPYAKSSCGCGTSFDFDFEKLS